MPKFQMTPNTHRTLLASLEGLTNERREEILVALSALCAEVELHVRKHVFEEIRQQWAENLATMLRSTI